MMDVYQAIHKAKQQISIHGLTFSIGLVVGLVITNTLWMRVSQKNVDVKTVSYQPETIHDVSTRTLERVASTVPPRIPRKILPGNPVRVQDLQVRTPRGETVNMEIVTTKTKDGERVTVQAEGAEVIRGQDRVFPVQVPRPWEWSVSLVGVAGSDGLKPGVMVQRSRGPWVFTGGVIVSPHGVPEKIFAGVGVRW